MSKKAVITSGNKQYLVEENTVIDVELLNKDGKDKTVEFKPLLFINDDDIEVGKPYLDKRTVIADIVNEDIQTDKVTSIRYKAKKRVHTVKGHRQHKTVLKITKIS